MRKVILIVLSIITAANLVLLIIALTGNSSLYRDRLIIVISFLAFGGFLREHILRYNKINK